MSTRVVLKLPNRRECGLFSTNSTSEADVFSELPKLFRVITQQHIQVRVPGTEFFVEVPDLAGCLYIAFPPTTGVENSSHKTIEVYAIKVEQGGRLSEGEIQNDLYDNFGKQLECAMSVVSGPKEDKTEERYPGYPCGTLLRVTSDHHPYHPSIAPHPAVATSTISASTQAMVAGTNDRKISQLSDSQLPDSSRKNLASVTCLHPEKVALSKWAIQTRVECNGDVNLAPKAGHPSDSTCVSLSNVSGAELAHVTPSRDNPQIVVTETDDGPVKLVIEAEEESSSNSAPNQEKEPQNQVKKSATVSLVTGMHVRTCSDVSVYEQLGEPRTDNMRPRTLSDSNIAERLKECMVVGNSKGIQESVTRRNSEPTPAPTSSLPHEPHRPIQRQSSGDNETVMGGARPTFGVSSEKQNELTKSNDPDGDKSVENGEIMKSKEDEEYLSTRAKVSFVVGEEEENASRDESFHSHLTTFSSHDQSELYEHSDDYITESEDPLVVEENSEVMVQVHLLEHACNGKCFKGSLCNIHLTEQQFPVEVQQMQAAVKSLVDGTAHPDSNNVKEYIRIHCTRCDMAGCKVPHMAAGCPPPPQKPVPSQPTPPASSKAWSLQTPECHAKRLPVGSISFDETAAFQSPSPSNDEHSEVKPSSNHNPIPTPKPSTLDLLKECKPPVAPSSPPLYVHHPHHPHSPPPTPHTPHNLYTYQKPLTPSFLPNRRLDQPITPRDVHHPTLATNQDFTDYQQQLKSSGFHGHNTTYQTTSVYQRQLGGAYSFLGQNTANTSTITPTRRLPDISVSGFPKNLSCYPWYSAGTSNAMLIYSSQELQDVGLMPGCDVPRPNMVKRDQLGSGGNGTVFKQFISGQEYAIKKTHYRPAELNIWHKLDHPNVIPLLGVMLDNNRSYCLQMMPKMTTDFREVIRGLHQRYGSVHHLVQVETQTWRELVQPNACYIFQEMLQGLNYLYQNNIQHGDLKATNVLIKKKCSCPDVLHCCCPRREKCEVRIADFDALRKTTQYSAKAANLPEVTTSAKTPEGMNTVLGTMGYRALEQFQKIDDNPATNVLVLTHKRIIDGSTTEVYDLSGPWCDVWSLGVILLQFCLGSPSQEDKTESWHLHHKPQEKQLNPQVEPTCAIVRLKKLLSMCANCHDLTAFSHLAEKCLAIQFRKRPTPEDLLNDDMFSR